MGARVHMGAVRALSLSHSCFPLLPVSWGFGFLSVILFGSASFLALLKRFGEKVCEKNKQTKPAVF